MKQQQMAILIAKNNCCRSADKDENYRMSEKLIREAFSHGSSTKDIKNYLAQSCNIWLSPDSFHEKRDYFGKDKASPLETPIGKLGLDICYDVTLSEYATSLTKAGASDTTYPSVFAISIYTGTNDISAL
uniref:CN hydrolase domain-containing protein n=1 Tax=Tetranychus urticae TaxID=32264 RepID=T1K7C5_TETUR